jgi:hypothetical protein
MNPIRSISHKRRDSIKRTTGFHLLPVGLLVRPDASPPILGSIATPSSTECCPIAEYGIDVQTTAINSSEVMRADLADGKQDIAESELDNGRHRGERRG